MVAKGLTWRKWQVSRVMVFQNIVANPEILGGKPIIKGTRISIEHILELLASGGEIKTIAQKYPQLSEAAIKEAILFSKRFIENEIAYSIKTAV